MTTIIEQADSIVGINPGATGLDERSRWWLRRGAYFEWLAGHGDMSEFAYDAPCSEMADRIVKLHAASKPKGDGLPEIEFNARNDMCGFVDVVACAKVPCSIDETGRLLKRLNEFNSPPVRRLLAAFEVVGEMPVGATINNNYLRYLRVTSGGRFLRSGEIPPDGDDVICWLVPRGER